MFHLFHKHTAPAAAPVEAIVVGLGNPGRQYEDTRHNAGFFVLDTLADKLNVKIDRLKFKGLTCTTVINGKGVLLLKPSTYMNRSGESVREAMQFYKLPPEKVLIVYDDISLEPGRLRIRRKGSDGGHNGMKNIIYLTGKDTFPRIKMGVGAKPNPNWDLGDWVLSKFTQKEGQALEAAADNACCAIALMLEGKDQEAMNKYNS
ncbi:MAG: aminoacyl-tRNA hydrolase [Oscillospiraceae bacterium]|nr:aminoacyl-tRNA hydrolase [Oscillospiraceae bacterium]